MPGTRRLGKQHVSRDVREMVVSRLLGLRERGEFRSQHVELCADGAGVPERTVWRWLRTAQVDGRDGRKARPRLEVTEDDVVELARHQGSVAAFHRARSKEGPTPSRGAWSRAFGRALSPGQRAGLARGEQARRGYDTYLTRIPRFRNECWEADHTQLEIRVLLPDGLIVRPWATLFVDCFSRAILAFAITVAPSRESILAAFRAAIMVEDPYGPFGGVPGSVRFDRGKDFLSRAIAEVARALAIEIQDLPGYAAHLKGTVERTNQSAEQLLLVDLPGYLHGARDRTGKLFAEGEPLLTLESFVELFADFARWFNTERSHQGLGGRTPLQQWEGDPTPLHVMDEKRLRHLMLVGDTRTVSKRGVRMNNRYYNCAELSGHVGTSVEVRYMPHHDGDVEVFIDGEHLGTAVPGERMSRVEMERLFERRAEDARWLRKVTRAGEKKRRRVYAAMTAPGTPQMVTVLTDEGTGVETSARADARRRALASRSLVRPFDVPARMVRPVVPPTGDAS